MQKKDTYLFFFYQSFTCKHTRLLFITSQNAANSGEKGEEIMMQFLIRKEGG